MKSHHCESLTQGLNLTLTNYESGEFIYFKEHCRSTYEFALKGRIVMSTKNGD